MRKKIVTYLLVLLACVGCRTSKDTTRTEHSRDSTTTTITTRPVELRIPADTATRELSLTEFTQRVHEAPVGAVIEQGHGKGRGVAYRIIKVAPDSVRFEARSLGKDTTIYVHDTLTVVRDRIIRETVRVQAPSLWQQIRTRISWAFWGILLLVAVLVTLRLTKRTIF